HCAALFQCASPHAFACTSASAVRPAPAGRGSGPSPAAPSAATCVHGAPARALQSIPQLSARPPCLMPSAPQVPLVPPLVRRLLLVPRPLLSRAPLSRRDP